MKKLILGISALLLAGTATQAQNVRFGVKGGANLTHATTSYTFNNSTISHNYLGPGFYAGGLMEVSFPKGSKFKLQPELLFNYHSMLSDNQNVRLGTIGIPVAFKFFPIPDFSLMAGPVFNFNVIGAYVNKNINDNVIKYGDNLNSFQPGVFFGANYYIHKGFFVDARYTYNFGDVVDYGTSGADFKYGNVSVGVGYKF